MYLDRNETFPVILQHCETRDLHLKNGSGTGLAFDEVVSTEIRMFCSNILSNPNKSEDLRFLP